MQMDDHKDDAADPPPEHARGVLERIRSGMAAAREPIADRVGQAWHERPGARVRRVRRMAKRPLPYLSDVHHEARPHGRWRSACARSTSTRSAGPRSVAGAQRGGDFLPLKASRTQNWASRWQRLRKAQDRLAFLPPIDVFKYRDRYWVVDGHNRVALALVRRPEGDRCQRRRARPARGAPDRTDRLAGAVGRRIACRPRGRQRPSPEPGTVAGRRHEHGAPRRTAETDDPNPDRRVAGSQGIRGP